ncbi:MAG: hypothetical protein WCL50_13810, partial [Spirochaetota bacterium]
MKTPMSNCLLIFGRKLSLPKHEANNEGVKHAAAPRPPRPLPVIILVLGLFLALPESLSGAATQSPMALPGDSDLAGLAENADLRQEDWEGFFAAPVKALVATKARILVNGWGAWKRQVIPSGGFAYLVYSAARGGSWPIYSQGTWIIKRAQGSGAFIQAKIFLKSDPGTFIRLYPDGDRSRMDLVIYGGVFRENLPLPWSFEKSLRLRVSDIIEASRDTVDWSLFEPDPADYGTIASLASAIRSRLPGLRYRDDGGLDAEGRLVYIASGLAQLSGGSGREPSGLNCSGFAQWVVDGLLRPRGGEWPDSAKLSVKHLETRKSAAALTFEDKLDPYFGLDWTRNLAEVARAVLEDAKEGDILVSDVTGAPFALVASSRDPVNGGRDY